MSCHVWRPMHIASWLISTPGSRFGNAWYGWFCFGGLLMALMIPCVCVCVCGDMDGYTRERVARDRTCGLRTTLTTCRGTLGHLSRCSCMLEYATCLCPPGRQSETWRMLSCVSPALVSTPRGLIPASQPCACRLAYARPYVPPLSQQTLQLCKQGCVNGSLDE